MFLGVVAQPIPHRNFDGYILLDQVSTQEEGRKLTSTRNFFDDFHANTTIKNGDWKTLFEGDTSMALTALDVKITVADYFALDDAIVDCLELSYCTFVGENGNKNIALLMI